jgi:hypothetical protein
VTDHPDDARAALRCFGGNARELGAVLQQATERGRLFADLGEILRAG